MDLRRVGTEKALTAAEKVKKLAMEQKRKAELAPEPAPQPKSLFSKWQEILPEVFDHRLEGPKVLPGATHPRSAVAADAEQQGSTAASAAVASDAEQQGLTVAPSAAEAVASAA